METFQKAIDLDPWHLKARFELSLLYARERYRNPSHRQKAIEHLRCLVEMYEELGDFYRIHDAFFILGSVYDDDPDDADLAIEVYKKGLQLAGASAEVHNNLGVLYSQKGSMDEAVKEFREAIRLDPDYESPYRNLAKIYFYQRNEEIVRDFQQWIEEIPEMSAKILFNLSLALMDVGRAEACESIYSRAHRIKNLIGVAGSKLRRVSREMDVGRAASSLEDDKGQRLMEILADQEKCYNEMVALLGTLKQDDLLLDMVDVNATINAVLRQMDFKPDDQTGRGMKSMGEPRRHREDMRHETGDIRLESLKSEVSGLKSQVSAPLRSSLNSSRLERAGINPAPTATRDLRLGDEESSSVECRMELAENLPRVKGDARKLKEAFNNVIINALEAMVDGGSLNISTKYSDSTSEVEVVFQDTGEGVSADDLDNILKPGYTTKESGSGFGLSIVDRIIKEHKGGINISSREGEGTEVRIRLPVNLELAPIQAGLRMRPVVYEDPSELIFTEVDQIVGI
jgi:signal transduction histidine kinase